MTRRTIVALHAHPDDESLLTAGTLARAAAQGDRVVLVLATRGESGDVGAGMLDGAADLGSLRSREAQASADALGVARLVFLELLDSGLQPTADGSWPPGSLCAADPDDVARQVVAILVEEDASLLIADDRNGGYGHPDHRRVHEVAVRAATRVGIPLLEATIDREFLTSGIALAESMGLSVPDGFVPPDVSSWYTPAAEITHAIAVGDALGAKRASMEAHASQATGAADTVRTLAVFLDLPEDVFALAFGTEWFVQHGAPTHPRADDLFAILPASTS